MAGERGIRVSPRSTKIDTHTRGLLWTLKREGLGFEEVLANLRHDYEQHGDAETESRLRIFEDALAEMFKVMNDGLTSAPFEHSPSSVLKLGDNRRSVSLPGSIEDFLASFDAIFTLNQDLLLEAHFFREGAGWGFLNMHNHPDGWELPGTRRTPLPSEHTWRDVLLGPREPDESAFALAEAKLPYFKLHGSINWRTTDKQGDERLLIMGGEKEDDIKRHPLLSWYLKQFQDFLGRPNTRLMVVGYSFGDRHINAVLETAARGGLKLFIIDPNGVDVLRPQDAALLYSRRPHPNPEALEPSIVGASRRPFRGIFEDHVEMSKINRFFDGSLHRQF